MSTSTDSEEIITLHTSKKIIDWDCYVYDVDVIHALAVGHIVRISLEVPQSDLRWSHDSPYVVIMKIDPDRINGEILGVVSNKVRADSDKHPLQCGERIYFKASNIIEIPIKLQTVPHDFTRFLTTQKVPVSGPLYTTEYENDLSDEDSQDSCSASSSGSTHW